MSLARAERRRLFRRRSTRIMLLLVVLVLATVGISFAATSHRHDAAALALGQQRADAEYQRQIGFHDQFVAECKAAKAAAGTTPASANPDGDKFGGAPDDCFASEGPQRDQFRAENFLPFQFRFDEMFPFLIILFAGLMALFGYVVAASYVGAEWNSGGMMNLLLWRPRRVGVLLTKLGTVLGGVLGVGVVIGAVWTLACWLIGRYDGSLGRLTPGVWRSLSLDGARAIGLALIATALGFALASLGRHTAMALGVAIGAILASEVGLHIALNLVGVQFAPRWLLSTYVAAWLAKSLTLYDYDSCNFNLGSCQPGEFVITWHHSAWLFGAVTLAAIAVAVWSMRRRDVT